MNSPSTASLSQRTIFRSAPEREALEAHVRGAIPGWLRGDLVRTAPAVFQRADWAARHWFDGLGLLFAFHIDPAGRVHFRQRLLGSEVARRIGEGRDDTPHFGTPMHRSLWDRARSPIPRANDNTNVNCKPYGRRLVAMTETNAQHDIDCATLRSRGRLRYEDRLGDAVQMLAHPHADFTRGVVVNVATDFSRRSGLLVYEHPMDRLERTVVAKIPLSRVPYLHSFGLTSRHAILLGGPFVVRPWTLLWSDRAYADHFRWRPELGTEIWRIDRGGGPAAKHTAPPMFVFHTLNSFERNDETVHDVLAFDDAGIVGRLNVEDLTSAPPDLRARPMRLVLRHGTEAARVEPLSEARFEFPSIDYRRFGGQAYRAAFGVSNGPAVDGYGSAVVRVDVASGKTRSLAERPWVFGEPVFVSRPGSEREGDGALLSVASHLDEPRAALAVLDAETLDVRAWVDVEVPIPLGFHGTFMRTPPPLAC
nr:apocarotenoid-15,15'-oxygenase [uncultured bacterium]